MTLLLATRSHDLGGFQVRRAVPTLQARSVGPFVFVDHMGPALFEPGRGIDVRPHPHIGLATVTYLWAGALRHRDTLGSVQDILPSDVNWMTAGRGFGLESPVQVFTDTFNAAVDLVPNAELPIAAEAVERALYVLEGQAQLDGADIPEKHLVVLDHGTRHVLRAKTPVKAMLFGGAPLDAPRHMWWNFVSSSKERIEQAKRDWDNGAFGLIPGDDVERIPLPEH